MARRGGFPGGGIPGNMNNLMKQAQRMQKQMEEKTKELEEKTWEASAGGGAVTVTGVCKSKWRKRPRSLRRRPGRLVPVVVL